MRPWTLEEDAVLCERLFKATDEEIVRLYRNRYPDSERRDCDLRASIRALEQLHRHRHPDLARALL